MEGRVLAAPDMDALTAAARSAAGAGVDAIFLSTAPLGDPLVLAAGLAAAVPTLLLGVRIDLQGEPHRHPTVLARDMTTLDLISHGRAILAFTAPFDDALVEAITLCRAMWREGVAASEGPHYPVAGAINRPQPSNPGSPRIALDLTDGTAAADAPVTMVDLLLVPAGHPAGPTTCTMREA